MAEAYGVEVAADATRGLIGQTVQEIQCLLNYKNNIKNLEKKVKELNARKDATQLSIDAAKRNGLVIGPDVLHWLEEVDDIMKDTNKILGDTRSTKWSCFFCKCPKLHSRYTLSKKALRSGTDVTKLQYIASKFDRIGHQVKPGQMPFTSPGEFNGFESRMMIFNNVMEALENNSVATIGICGMAGVGKTTLVKEIADKVKSVSLYDEIAMAVVSNDPVISKIQNQLAECLGMKIEEETDRGRAERLYTRLKGTDNKILLILDDLWETLDFRKIGIPVEGKNCGVKVLLTSRYKRVCVNMKAKPFDVNVLSEEESWHLFKEISEISEESNEIKDLAKEVANECGGLPLAIVTVGGMLKNKEDYAWRAVLEEMKEASVLNIPDMEKMVFSRIKLSYTYLEENSKIMLLLCSLFPEDHNIELEDLVRYSKGLKLFKSVETVTRARDKIYYIIDELKNCYLLLEGNGKKLVKLHDVIRDVCLSIASSDEHMHMIKHTGLLVWPQEDNYTSSTAISLTFDNIDELNLPTKLDYPKLKLLKLSFQTHKLHICEDFFIRMKELKVLELYNLYSDDLPSSLLSLVNLRTLCFRKCTLRGDISVIGSLTKLEILSFYKSKLEHFADKISELSNLKTLDLRFQTGPPLLPGILLRLQTLEELYLGFNSDFQEQQIKGEETYSVIITEISSLLNLQTFQFSAYNIHCLEQVVQNLHYQKLMRFEITSTIHYEDTGKYQFGKVLSLKGMNVDFLKKDVAQYLLSKTENLSLWKIDGLTNLVSELDGKGFVSLRKLRLVQCDLKYLVDATSLYTTSGKAFVNLEKLSIMEAENLEELCYGNSPITFFARLRQVEVWNLPALRHLWGSIQQPSLGNLRVLKIAQCRSLRSLFLKSSVKCLLQLEEMEVNSCEQLETVVSNDEEEDTRDIEFPMLKSLKLRSLDNFRSFGSDLIPGGVFEKVILRNLETLNVLDVKSARCIFECEIPTGSLSKLQTNFIDDCNGLVHDHYKVSNNFKLVMQIEEGAKSLESPLARLKSLKLQNLPKLKIIWRFPEGLHAFNNLKELSVSLCGSLRYLLTPSMARMLVSIESLFVNRCAQMEAIIGVDEMEFTDIESDVKEFKKEKKKDNKIVFPNLKEVDIYKLGNLRMLCLEDIDMELPSLSAFRISNCPKMTKFCAGHFSAVNLNNVINRDIDDKEKVNIDEFGSWLKDCESRIRCLQCSFHEIEKCHHLG